MASARVRSQEGLSKNHTLMNILTNRYTPWKLTCPQKRDYFNRKYIFQPSFFRGYVSFQGGNPKLWFGRSISFQIWLFLGYFGGIYVEFRAKNPKANGWNHLKPENGPPWRSFFFIGFIFSFSGPSDPLEAVLTSPVLASGFSHGNSFRPWNGGYPKLYGETLHFQGTTVDSILWEM